MNDNDAAEVVFEYTGNEPVPKNVTHVRFHSSVTQIGSLRAHIVEDAGDAVFDGCSNLREVVFNERLHTIGYAVFRGCSSLESITFPSTLEEISYDAFRGCSSLREVIFNKGLINIANDSFSYCQELRKVKMNEGVRRIGINAFRGCSYLQSITLPSTITNVEQFAFRECTSLRSVELHEGIGDGDIWLNAFDGCLELERLSFPRLSTRLNNIIRASQTEIRNKIDVARSNWRVGVELRNGELFVPRSVLAQTREAWESIRQSLNRVNELTTYYEIREATSMFELALWKANIDRADSASINRRDSYRIEVPGPVKDTILQYLRDDNYI